MLVFVTCHYKTENWLARILLLCFLYSIQCHSLQQDFDGNSALASHSADYHYESIDVEQELPAIDMRRWSQKQKIKEATERVPHLQHYAIHLESGKRTPKYFRNSSCAKYPELHNLEISNTLWQTQESRDGTLYMFSAYYDSRSLNITGQNSLRIVSVLTGVPPYEASWCQIWFENETEPVFSNVSYIEHEHFSSLLHSKPKYRSYLLSCEVPRSHQDKAPVSVSVVEKQCEHATNNLKVIHDQERPVKREGFAVCVKGLDFPYADLSVRLIEWIELQLLLGAHKVFFYEYANHPNVTKVLKFYESRGQVELRPLTLPGGQPNDPHLRNHLLTKYVPTINQGEGTSYQDCFYRNLYKYEYMVLIDIDEAVIPLKEINWADMVAQLHTTRNRLGSKDFDNAGAGFSFKNVFFIENSTNLQDYRSSANGIPKYHYLLNEIHRQPRHTYNHRKSFQSTRTVKSPGIHSPNSCLKGPCRTYLVSTADAQLQHYRPNCRVVGNVVYGECKKMAKKPPVKDVAVWRYKDQLLERTKRVLQQLGFLPQTETLTR